MSDEALRPFKVYRDIGLRDLARAFQRLLKAPAFTIAAVLALAVGIGATTTMFSVASALLFRRLPYPDSPRLVSVRERQPGLDQSAVAFANFLDVQAAQKSFAGFSLARVEPLTLSPEGIGGQAEQLRAGQVTWDFLRTLKIQPRIGRDFTETEDTPGGPRAALISAELFARRFENDPAMIGRTIVLNGHPHTVIGVVPTVDDVVWRNRSQRGKWGLAWLSSPRSETLDILDRAEVLVPFHDLRADPTFNSRGDHLRTEIYARLKPAASLREATSELETIYAGLARQYPGTNTGVGPVVRRLDQREADHYRQATMVLCGAVICVLVAACANVANLLLARSVSRQREYAIRAALGAGRSQIMRELLAENNVLTIAGGLLGILITVWARDFIAAAAPEASRLQELRIDGWVLLLTSLVCVTTELIFGLWPALQTTRSIDLNAALAGGSRSTSASAQTQRVRAGLVVAQVALAMVLLSGAAMLLTSFIRLQKAPLGFDPGPLLKLEIALPQARYDTEERSEQFYAQLVARLTALPGVAGAATSAVPLLAGQGWTMNYRVPGAPVVSGIELSAETNVVSAAYFETLGVHFLSGRGFDAVADRAGGETHIIIDEAMARRHFPGADPIGKRLDRAIDTRTPGDIAMIIVGVVPTLRRVNLARDPDLPQFYFHSPQFGLARRTVLVRVEYGESQAIAEAVKHELSALDSDVAAASLRSVDQVVSQGLAPQRLILLLFGAFAGIALVLAIVGLYSVMSLTVAQRSREMGIRIALGAEPASIAGLLLRRGLTLVAIGLVIGLGGAWLLGIALGAAVTDASTLEPLVVGVVATALAGAAALACWLPARRATRMDPVEALRAE